MKIKIDLDKVHGMLLPIRSEPYEVECNEYLIENEFIVCKDGKLVYKSDGKSPCLAEGDVCPYCHGTGRRTVRLVGVVDGDIDPCLKIIPDAEDAEETDGFVAMLAIRVSTFYREVFE